MEKLAKVEEMEVKEERREIESAGNKLEDSEEEKIKHCFSNIVQSNSEDDEDDEKCEERNIFEDDDGISKVGDSNMEQEKEFSVDGFCKYGMTFPSMPCSSLFSAQEYKHNPSSSKPPYRGANFAKNTSDESCSNSSTPKRRYECDKCNDTFGRFHGLVVLKCIHTENECDTSFPVSSHLKVHKRARTGKRPYCCDVCNASFTKSDHLKIHKRTHTGERPYQCDECDASFASSSKLKRHKHTHTGERPHHCDECEASFISSSDLKIHKRTHSGYRPYQCDDCDASFTAPSNLKTHKRIHTGERPYHCDECDASFSASTHLKTHKRTHTGERPFSCDECDARFTRSNNLKKHKLKKHA